MCMLIRQLSKLYVLKKIQMKDKLGSTLDSWNISSVKCCKLRSKDRFINLSTDSVIFSNFFFLCGENYFYFLFFQGTSEINHCSRNANYSLNRKNLRNVSCKLTTSPPIALTSLPSLPQKLINYDSLESVRKSPLSTSDSTYMWV